MQLKEKEEQARLIAKQKRLEQEKEEMGGDF